MKITKEYLQQIIKEELEAVLSEEEFYVVEALDENEEYCPACAPLEEKKEEEKEEEKEESL